MEVFEIKNFGAGYDDSITPEMAKENTTQDSKMVDYSSEIGALQKDTGERNIGGSAASGTGSYYGSAVYGVSVYGKTSVSTDFYPLPGPIQRIYEGMVDVSGTGDIENKRLVIAGGIPYQYCAGDQFIPLSSVALFSSITTDIPDITHYDNSFYITSGHDLNVMQWNGVNASLSTNAGLAGSASAGMALFRGKTMAYFNNRMWLGNTKESDDGGTTWNVYETRVRYAAQGHPNVWDIYDDAYVTTDEVGYINTAEVGGDEVLRLYPYKDRMIVFNRDSVNRIIETGGGTFPYDNECIDRSAVNNAPWSIATMPQGVIFLNDEGLQITDGETVAQFEADKKVNQLLKRINKGAMNLCFGIANDSTHEYWLSIPVDGSEWCNRIIVYNWRFDTWKIRVSDTTTMGMLTTGSNGTWEDIEDYYAYELMAMTWSDYRLYPGNRRVIMGRDDGFVREKSLAFNIAGSAYDSYHTTPWLDFGLPGIMKEVVQIQPLWEGTEGDSVTFSFKSDSDGSWTSVTSDAFDATYIPEQPLLFMRKVGRKFKFRFSNNNANENYRIYNIKIYYEKRALR